jgi:hypothetical protein
MLTRRDKTILKSGEARQNFAGGGDDDDDDAENLGPEVRLYLRNVELDEKV